MEKEKLKYEKPELMDLSVSSGPATAQGADCKPYGSLAGSNCLSGNSPGGGGCNTGTSTAVCVTGVSG